MQTFKVWLAENYDENGFWVGPNGSGGASGVLPICDKTGRICLGWRSGEVQKGNCWGVFGGAVPRDYTPEEHALIELQEETGYKGRVKLIPAFVFKKGSFSYHNYLGVVAEEFKFKPSPDYAWETDRIEWMTHQQIQDEMKENQHDFHPGVLELFRHSRELIQNTVAKYQKANN